MNVVISAFLQLYHFMVTEGKVFKGFEVEETNCHHLRFPGFKELLHPLTCCKIQSSV